MVLCRGPLETRPGGKPGAALWAEAMCPLRPGVWHFPQVKQRENGVALRCFPGVVRSLDTLGWEERQLALVKGLLAGNVFDWGAKAVSE